MSRVYVGAIALSVLSALCAASTSSNCDPQIIATILKTKTLLKLNNFENKKVWIAAITKGVLEPTTAVEECCGAIDSNGMLPATICKYQTCDDQEESVPQTCFGATYCQTADGVIHGEYSTSEMDLVDVYVFNGSGQHKIQYRCSPTGARPAFFALVPSIDVLTISEDDFNCALDEVNEIAPGTCLEELQHP